MVLAYHVLVIFFAAMCFEFGRANKVTTEYGEVEMDGNTFYIFNKKFPHAKLTQFGIGSRDIGTYELATYPDQMWTLQAHPTIPDYYYITNADHEGYRIAKWGRDDDKVGNYNGQYYNDQLWKFVSNGDGYYLIYNYEYPDARITKFSKTDKDWGTYSGGVYDDQLWKLVPRYAVEVRDTVIWSADNRQGTQAFEQVVQVTTGLVLTSSTSFTSTFGLTVALESSFDSVVGVSSSMSMEMHIQLENSMSSSEERNWSKTTSITFSAPPGTNYRVKQLTADFSSPNPNDDCVFKFAYKIEQIDGEFLN